MYASHSYVTRDLFYVACCTRVNMPNKQHLIQQNIAMCVISFHVVVESLSDSSVLFLIFQFLKLCIEIRIDLKVIVSQKNGTQTNNESRKGANDIVENEYEIRTNEEIEISKQAGKKTKAKKVKKKSH